LLVGINLIQAYAISPMRSDRYHSLEALYLRFAQQQNGPEQLTRTGRFLFITAEDWNIYGFHSFQNAYGIPPAQTQLLRTAIQDKSSPTPEERVALPPPRVVDPDEIQPILEIEAWAVEVARQPDTVVILQPWLPDYQTLSVMRLMDDLGKQPCAIRSGPEKDVAFTIWLDSSFLDACPDDGHWPRFW
jgi:hypothetical protein